MGSSEPSWPSKASDLVFAKQLGQGFCGEVWRCSNKSAAQDAATENFAVKKVPLAVIAKHNITRQMEREIETMRSLQHPRIVRLFFDFRDSEHVYLGMEFAEGGSMFDLLSKSGIFGYERSALYFYQVCDALQYLHTRPEKIIHRDIKPENILLDKQGHVKLADFGWANSLKGTKYRATFCGTPDYLAPEMIRGDGHNQTLDMWQMGVLLFEMTVGKSPFGSDHQELTTQRILEVDLRFPRDMDEAAQDLVKSLCRLRPQERLTASEGKEHPFITKFQPSLKSLSDPNEEGPGVRPSVEARWLMKELDCLKEEVFTALKAKAASEDGRDKALTDLEAAHEKFHHQKQLREVAEAEQAKLQDKEREQLQQLNDLKNTESTLQAELSKLKMGSDRRGSISNTSPVRGSTAAGAASANRGPHTARSPRRSPRLRSQSPRKL